LFDPSKIMFLTFFSTFISIVVLGDAAIISLIYLSFIGKIGFSFVVAMSLFATIANDVFWYYIGFFFPSSKIVSLFSLKKFEKKYLSLFEKLDQESLRILFYSKFIHGVRLPVRIYYGVRKMSLLNFIWVNILNTLLYLAILGSIVALFEGRVANLENLTEEIVLILSAMFIVAFLIHLVVKRFVLGKSNVKYPEKSCPGADRNI